MRNPGRGQRAIASYPGQGDQEGELQANGSFLFFIFKVADDEDAQAGQNHDQAEGEEYVLGFGVCDEEAGAQTDDYVS